MRLGCGRVGWLALVAVSLVVLSSCSGSSKPDAEADPGTPVAVGEVAAAASTGFESVASFHATAELALSAGSAEADFLRVESWVDVANDTARSAGSEPVEPASEDFAVTFEVVGVGDTTWTNTKGAGWIEGDDDLVDVLLAGFSDVDSADLSTAVSEIASAATAGWVQRTDPDSGVARYESNDPTTGTIVSLSFDQQGRLVLLQQVKPPSGVDVEESRRGRFTIRFDGFDDTVVELPTDLPTS